MGAFAFGTAGPNLEKITTARAAAFSIWNLIDRVITVLLVMVICVKHRFKVCLSV